MSLQTLNITTTSRVEIQDITDKVSGAIKRSGVKNGNGICVVYTPHTTAAITVNENADPDVKTDLVMEINKIIPFSDNYLHMEGNSAAHLKSSLFGASEHFIIENGRLLLGTWQGIMFCEFDGPRNRQVRVKIIEG